MRGVKHHDARPDFCFVDDVEELEHVRSPEARQETLNWFMAELMPALDKDARIRVSATPLDREALPAVLSAGSAFKAAGVDNQNLSDRIRRPARWSPSDVADAFSARMDRRQAR